MSKWTRTGKSTRGNPLVPKSLQWRTKFRNFEYLIMMSNKATTSQSQSIPSTPETSLTGISSPLMVGGTRRGLNKGETVRAKVLMMGFWPSIGDGEFIMGGTTVKKLFSTDSSKKSRAFSQHENESLTDAWLRMKEMLRNCQGHNLSKGNIIKIFFHGLSEITKEVLNAAAGGIFLYKTPNQAYQLLEDKVLLKLDWAKNQKTKSSLKKTVAFADEGSSNTDTDKIMARMDAMTIKMDAQYKELQSRAKQPTSDLDDDDIPMSREEEAKFMQTFRKTRFYNDYRDRDSNRDNWRSSGRNDYNRDNYRSNTDDKPYDLQKQFNDFMKSQQSTNAFNLETKFDRLADKQSGRPSGSLPSNTQPNPRGSNSKAYQPPQARNEHVNAVFTRSGKSYNPPENPNEEQNKTENPINFESDDEDDEPTPQLKIQT
ncbi:hypothetical protein Tco_0382921 [Tanacetum coccineum]